MMKKLLLILLCLPMIGFGQQTFVPDDNFEQALINLGYDDVLNNYVLTATIDTITSLHLHQGMEFSLQTGVNFFLVEVIEDITGIEDFISLTTLASSCPLATLNLTENSSLVELYVSNSQIQELDLSNNFNLTTLDCSYNQLTNLNLSNNTDLDYLRCGNNQLTNLDLSNNTALDILSCGNNQLNELDLVNNTSLTGLGCSGNNIDTLDLTQNNSLIHLDCPYNEMNSLLFSADAILEAIRCEYNDLTNLTIPFNSLLGLWCFNNPLNSLDLSSANLWWLSCHDSFLSEIDVSNSPNLITLLTRFTNLTSLDVSNNPVLDFLDVFESPFLSSVDLRNGNNEGLFFSSFQNPELSCIMVDDVGLANSLWGFGGSNGSVDLYYSSFTTDDCSIALGCTDSDACNFNPLASIDDGSCAIDNLEVEIIPINISCFERFDGEIQANILSGTPPYTIELYEGADMLESIVGDTSQVFNELAEGTYSLSVIDSNGCSIVENSLEIIEPDAVVTSEIFGNIIVNAFGLESYSVEQTVGSTYEWIFVDGGYIAAGLTTSLIQIQWANTGGYYNLEVIETDTNDCQGDTMNISILLHLPSWDCVGGACVDPLDNSGEFVSLTLCETECTSLPSWDCIADACVDPTDGSGFYSSLADCEVDCHTSSITSPNIPTKKLKKITNLLGQEIPIRKNTPMFYIYDDGTVEKKIIIE